MDEQDNVKQISFLSKLLKFLGFVGKQFLLGSLIAILLATILGIIIFFTSGTEMALKGVAAVVTQRRVFLKDTGEETPREKQEHQRIHIDTNCMVLSNRCADLLVLWSHWPQAFGTGEDRIFSAILNATGKPIAFTTEATVLYWSEWPIHYSLANKPVPKTAKKPTRRAATHFHASSF